MCCHVQTRRTWTRSVKLLKPSCCRLHGYPYSVPPIVLKSEPFSTLSNIFAPNLRQGTENMSNPQVPQAASSILNKFYPSVAVLQNYLQELLQDNDEHAESLSKRLLLREGDSEAYIHILSTTFITRKCHQHRKIKPHSSMLDMREVLRVSIFWRVNSLKWYVQVIDEAQHRLLRMKGSQNVITSGYRLVCSHFWIIASTQPSCLHRHPDLVTKDGMAWLG